MVVAPKTLLRLPAAGSSLADLAPGAAFQTVLTDTKSAGADARVDTVVLVSGRHYYTLAK